MHYQRTASYYLPILIIIFFISCNEEQKVKEKDVVADPESINAVIQRNIKTSLSFAMGNAGKIEDSLHVDMLPAINYYYTSTNFSPVWSDMEKWQPFTQSVMNYFDKAAEDGLFRQDYHFKELQTIKQTLDADSLKRMDAVLWAKADLLLTDAFMHIIQDLKQGRLQPDSLSWKNNKIKHQSFFSTQMERLKKAEPLDSIFKSLQPEIKGYWALKSGIKSFIDSMDTKTYTYVTYPYKAGDTKDSLAFTNKLTRRLAEAAIVNSEEGLDSLELAKAIKKYQQLKKMTADGKITSQFIRKLNMTDPERYDRIAITLDKYKALPEKMPERYILVNLPAFYLQVWDSDTVAFTSKVICGKPTTSTPLLDGDISNLVIFPTWTVPSSIIKKEILPGLKKNSGYLARKGLNLYNNKGERVDPASVNWAKYSKGIPYKVQQGSGDDNALGVIKFNFNNPFDVYLHDTNQRYLFSRSMRALSHGCVRVQDWEKLAFYIIRNDSIQNAGKDTLRYTTDSIINWIAKKQKHRIDVKNKIPLFIRYFGCEGIDGDIKFHDDIYDEDKRLNERYFTRKQGSL